jgi:OOP family OmpA-OmpF porin
MLRKGVLSLLAASILAWSAPVRADYEPQNNLVELGLFLGILIPSADHQLLDERRTHQPFQDVAFDFGLRAAYLPLSFLGAEFEGAVMPTLTADDKSALLYHIRLHAILQYPARLTPFVLLGGGWMGLSSSDSALGKDADWYPHWGLGLKFFPKDRIGLRLDFRHIIGASKPIASPSGTTYDGRASHFEVLFGLSYVLGRKEKEQPKDSDGDGIVDEKDKCPNEAGDPPDGCPKPKDSDGDGIVDAEDKCPSQAGEPPDGCPKPKDSDGDGIVDAKDKCPNEAGKPPDGCPVKDSDGDGIFDDKDKCPKEPETKNGYQDDDGCPDEIPAAVQKFTGAIKGITFDVNKATIRKTSFKVLDEAVKVLTEYSALRVKVRGHTDNTGKREKNMTLSENRAKAVVDYLIGKGIAADRLTHEGLGPDEPVADNKTAKGKAENRRIEFKLVTD